MADIVTVTYALSSGSVISIRVPATLTEEILRSKSMLNAVVKYKTPGLVATFKSVSASMSPTLNVLDALENTCVIYARYHNARIAHFLYHIIWCLGRIVSGISSTFPEEPEYDGSDFLDDALERFTMYYTAVHDKCHEEYIDKRMRNRQTSEEIDAVCKVLRETKEKEVADRIRAEVHRWVHSMAPAPAAAAGGAGSA